jgi:cytochrome P450
MATDLEAVNGEGKPDDLGLMLGSILMDGFHTLSVAVTNLGYTLLSEPLALQAVREDRSLIPKAFYDGVRLAPPTIFTQRYALADVEHDGLVIPRGTPITMLWLAGNRDPEVFEDPGTYRLSRPIGRDTTFGGGVHLCPGRNVSKLLAETVLAALTEPDVDISLAGSGFPWLTGSTMHQLEKMPVTLVRR